MGDGGERKRRHRLQINLVGGFGGNVIDIDTQGAVRMKKAPIAQVEGVAADLEIAGEAAGGQASDLDILQVELPLRFADEEAEIAKHGDRDFSAEGEVTGLDLLPGGLENSAVHLEMDLLFLRDLVAQVKVGLIKVKGVAIAQVQIDILKATVLCGEALQDQTQNGAPRGGR